MASDRLFTSLGASARELESAWPDRLQDAIVLRDGGRSSAAVAMAIYALEIRLKLRICRHLDIEKLPRPCETHDLRGLLVLTGLSRAIRKRPFKRVLTNWNEIVKVGESVPASRYKPEPGIPELAEQVIAKLNNPNDGILPWISSQE
jgi:hypothetical protein